MDVKVLGKIPILANCGERFFKQCFKSKTYFMDSLGIRSPGSGVAYCLIPASLPCWPLGDMQGANGQQQTRFPWKSSSDLFGHFVNTFLEHFSSDKSGLFCQKNVKSRKTQSLEKLLSYQLYFSLCVYLR